ncbi:hypothetical protein [Amycolatopsis sp. WQ 127309]|uniref:hypothetical protein n=1 Tax=Amycolatopsis sp. WQ 127309 TaxID=2932773 RepID=UPI001FF5BC8C|nr:hypothetical protein [Amycolatopsis sp. WQ 127309]UOZ10549.1 hypothetical protein MUY22_20700 [Amycolatopsis sp. WQ 127309]
MSNTVEIVVQGKNEATKIFRQVSGDATDAARDSEQAWTKSMTSINSSIERGGFGATEAGGGFNRLKESVKGAGDATGEMGKRSEEGADRLHKLGEASDEVDTRAMGFRDTVTGVQDTLKGLSDQSLSTGDRLFTLGAGIGDLGSAGYNLLVPAMTKVKQVISDVRDPTTDLGGRMKGLGKSIAGVGAGAAIIAGIGLALDAAFADKAANVNALSFALNSFAQTGKASGEAARVFGGNLDDLKTSLEMVNGGGIAKFIEGVYDLIPGSDLVGVSMSEAKDKISALDQSLTQLAQRSPSEAGAAFEKLTTSMGLNFQQVKQLRDQLPGFTNAMQQSANAADGSAQAQQRNAAALSDYLTQLQAATDPVFGLLNALTQVNTAQTAYNDAVKQYGVNSGQAKDASVGLAQAVAGAEAAALNGQLSYSDFSAALDHWVQSGVVTAQQASSIRDRVNEAHNAANAYTGNYDASLFMENHASNVIAQVRRDLDAVPDNTYKRFYMTYINQIIGNAPSSSPAGFGFVGHNAHGGPIGHAATGGGRGGMTWVGEQGPELVKLPVGSFVNPAGTSSRGGGSRAGASDSAPEVRIVIDLSGGDQRLMDWFKNRIRIEGGNVQTVLGAN